jgi:hypothetical protein
LLAGITCTALIADPKSWIRRRVETVEMLSHEETRRRVSIDFALTEETLDRLAIEDGIVVPISVLTKEPRKKFDLHDESGRSVPVLGRDQNGELAHTALLNAALDALPDDVSDDVIQMLSADLRQVVFSSPDQAADALGFLYGSAEAGDPWRAAIVSDQTCQGLLDVLWSNYVLFAVLQPGGARRRILKFSYADDFDLSLPAGPLVQRFAPSEIWRRIRAPDHKYFIVECGGAWRAASFHAEVAVPEELKVVFGTLHDFEADAALGRAGDKVNRLSVYASTEIAAGSAPGVFLEVAAERGGRPTQGAVTAVVIAALLWLGVISGLDAKNPGAAVSTLLAGAALYTGLFAAQGEHRLVRTVFAASRRWLGAVASVALLASASLAMEYPRVHPVALWRGCAIVATVAAVRLMWSAIRAPS